MDIRDGFFNELYHIMQQDSDVFLLSGDLVCNSMKQIKQNLPSQFINCGTSEQNMINVACGMSMTGKKVYVYSMTPFLVERCFEQIKLNIAIPCHPVTLIGSGVGFCYGMEGHSHYCMQDIGMILGLPNITIFSTSNGLMSKHIANESYKLKYPCYVRLDKDDYSENQVDDDVSKGFNVLRNYGSDLLFISTGVMVHKAVKVSDMLYVHNEINSSVVDLYRLKPVDRYFLNYIENFSHVVTVEETYPMCGLGNYINNLINVKGLNINLKQIGVPLFHQRFYGSRNWLHNIYKINIESIKDKVLKWIIS